jgi:cation diffusion facilitator family transporter
MLSQQFPAPGPTVLNYSTGGSLYRDTTRAALLGLVINVTLGVVKLTGGLRGNSYALVADAVNSLGDVLTSLIVLFALRVAQAPPDAEHPYGHTRAEAIAGANVALLLIVSALLVGWEAVHRFPLPHAMPPRWTLWIAGINVLIKEGLYRYQSRVGRRTGSSAIVAGAWDHRSDALCSLAVLVGLGTVRWGGPAWIGADEIAATVVVTLIIWSGIVLFRHSSSELMDLQADPELVEDIRQTAQSIGGVLRVEKLWVRKSGLEYFVDIHIEVDAQLTVAAGHRIGHQVKDRLVAEYPSLRDVLVHLEPYLGESSVSV